MQQLNRVVISGLPGSGKTELASQMAWNARDSLRYYKGVFWLNADSTASLQAGIQDMARGMKLIEEQQLITATAEEIQEMVLQELNSSDHWLLILDNLDEASILKNFLPQRRDTRHVLITSRHRAMSSALKARQIDLNPLSQQEAITLFNKSANCSEEGSHYSERQLLELVNALGCLPLAIVQAGAYLSETQDDVSNYFRFYKSSRKDIWGWKPSQDSSYITVATVMAISFGKVKESEVSVRLFCLLSFLDPTRVPETLLTTSNKFQDPRDIFRSPTNVNSALQPLITYNFVQRRDGNISMHRLVQDVMRDIIERELQDQGTVLDMLHDFDRFPQYWVERAIELLSIAYPSSCPNTWNHCAVYNPHATNCITYGNKYSLESEMFADLERAVGKYTFDQGGYVLARDLFESALRMYEHVCGEDDIKTANVLSDFGQSLARLGRHHEAIEQFERLLKLNDTNSFKDARGIASVIRDIGKSLFGLGKYDEALQSFERALRINESAFPADPIESARIIASISDVLRCKRQFRKAYNKCEEALKIEEQILGKDHIDSAGLISQSGGILGSRGQHRKALRRFERSLMIYENALGKDHIESVEAIANIGLTSLHLGKCSEALERFKHAIKITESVFGKEHFKVGSLIWNVGSACLFLGRRDEARVYWERGLKVSGKQLCEGHDTKGINGL